MGSWLFACATFVPLLYKVMIPVPPLEPPAPPNNINILLEEYVKKYKISDLVFYENYDYEIN